MRKMSLIGTPTTGQTPLFARQMQDWAQQHVDDKGIECYCLDAPEYVPTGVTMLAYQTSMFVGGQSVFKGRDNY